MIDKVTS